MTALAYGPHSDQVSAFIARLATVKGDHGYGDRSMIAVAWEYPAASTAVETCPRCARSFEPSFFVQVGDARYCYDCAAPAFESEACDD